MRIIGNLCFSALVTANIAFSRPLQFSEAVQSREIRSILPTMLSSEELRDLLGPDIMERAFFSARMANYGVLNEWDKILADYTSGKIDIATTRLQLLESLRAIGYVPPLWEAGEITDFSSDKRIDLILRTNAQIAWGYGQFIQGQSQVALDTFPAQELFRLRRRKQERNWVQRWHSVGGELHGGRMVALKDDAIWKQIGSAFKDSLGNPYPPFAFGSGMWVRDIRRDEAVDLGVIKADSPAPNPQDRGFNEDLEVTPETRNAALFQALEESLGDDWKFDNGVLTHS